ncbi:MAG TPA: EscU/YscU/HrcU family type III secretion system export apparatus switch protein [Candidatus Cybelea sp.]|nr:EscU/YscU/HrcU family type III secretion system export apparatus switch protein [Candidatus Cybelea sp.]
MSDGAEKAFEPTPRRIAKAKREGNVARSSELAANVSFAVAAFAIVASAARFGSVAGDALIRSQSFVPAPSCALVLGVALIPIGAAAIAGAIASIAQNGGLALVPVTPKIERLNPIEGMRRILSRETLSHSLRAAFAFLCAMLAMTPALAAGAAAMIRSPDLSQTVDVVWSAAQHVAFAAGAVGLLFSVAEFGAARTSWLRKLRMSFEERKREVKEEEGDALARGRRRSLHRALLRGGLTRVKEAAFVVVNPTHFAVALAYRPPQVPVPEVLVRARGEAAVRVREMAAVYRVPIVENVALARSLYRDGRPGEPISTAHYVAVAEVVAALLRANEIAG